MLELIMARKEIVVEIKARGKRGPPGYSPVSFGWPQPHLAMRPTISPLSILNPVKVCHTRPVTELLGFYRFPTARAGFIRG
jgi:hypothetical protein